MILDVIVIFLWIAVLAIYLLTDIKEDKITLILAVVTVILLQARILAGGM